MRPLVIIKQAAAMITNTFRTERMVQNCSHVIGLPMTSQPGSAAGSGDRWCPWAGDFTGQRAVLLGAESISGSTSEPWDLATLGPWELLTFANICEGF